MDAVVIEKAEASAVLRRARSTSEPSTPWVQALKAGRMVFVPESSKTSFAARAGRWPKRRGLKVRQHRATRDNVVGYYVWTEPITEGGDHEQPGPA